MTLSEKIVPHAKVLRKRFKLILEGKIKDKVKALSELKEKYRHPWDRGYLLGMEAILIKKSKEYENQLILNDNIADLTKLLSSFYLKLKDRLYRGFDKGYFQCLVDYMTFILKHQRRFKNKDQLKNQAKT